MQKQWEPFRIDLLELHVANANKKRLRNLSTENGFSFRERERVAERCVLCVWHMSYIPFKCQTLNIGNVDERARDMKTEGTKADTGT